jgi:hypothetical protein
LGFRGGACGAPWIDKAPAFGRRFILISLALDVHGELLVDRHRPAQIHTVVRGHILERAAIAETEHQLEIVAQSVGTGTIRTQPGKFGLGGGGLVFGRSGAEPVTDDYPGERPWAFTGGTIKRVVIDVSGDAFIDLTQEAAAAFARQ